MSQNSENIVIVGASRTPMGGFQGCLSSVTAPDLGSRSIAAALDQTPIEKGEINEVLMGCVLPAGQGQAPARQASLGAGIPMDCAVYNAEQNVRFRNENGDDGLRPTTGEQWRNRCRRRHGEHEQCALHSAKNAQWGPPGS